MNQHIIATQETAIDIEQSELRFFTETIDAGRVSPLAFFEAGQSCYAEELFYWQNANQTLTLVGIGHANVLTSDKNENRFSDISTGWAKLCAALIKEEKDVAPVLFGGFSFDPKNVKESEWKGFPSAYFVVPSFQLIRKNGKTLISINLITTSEDNPFESTRDHRALDYDNSFKEVAGSTPAERTITL